MISDMLSGGLGISTIAGAIIDEFSVDAGWNFTACS
jgi:hypothetical protein